MPLSTDKCKKQLTMYKKWQIRMYSFRQIRMSVFPG
jgi:hypothetical protein